MTTSVIDLYSLGIVCIFAVEIEKNQFLYIFSEKLDFDHHRNQSKY